MLHQQNQKFADSQKKGWDLGSMIYINILKG